MLTGIQNTIGQPEVPSAIKMMEGILILCFFSDLLNYWKKILIEQPLNKIVRISIELRPTGSPIYT